MNRRHYFEITEQRERSYTKGLLNKEDILIGFEERRPSKALLKRGEKILHKCFEERIAP